MPFMPQVPQSEQTSRLGILAIATACYEMGHIWRETPNTDVGFDGEIELREAERATGQILKVQCRAGASWMRGETAEHFSYYADANQLEYWNRATNPAILVIHDPRDRSSYWVDIKKYLRAHTEVLSQRPHKIVFSKADDGFDADCGAALHLLFGTDDKEADAAYCQHLSERFSKLTLYSVASDAPLAIDLERVFVRLTVQPPPVLPDVPVLSERIPLKLTLQDWARMSDAATSETSGTGRAADGQTQVGSDMSTLIGLLNSVSQTPERFPASPPQAVEEALRAHPHLIVVGAPGAGKTTLLKYLALKFARGQAKESLRLDSERVPLFVALRDFNRFLDNMERRGELTELGSGLLPRFLHEHTRAAAPHLKLPDGYFERALNAGRCAVLLDGLDEVADPRKRARVAEAAATFIGHYVGNRFVLTSRPRGYEQEARQRLSPLCAECRVRDFERPDRLAFVRAWYEAVLTDQQGDTPTARDLARSQADDLLRAVEGSPKIAALARNPLLLSVLAMVHQRGVGLPQRRAELYDECTDMLLGYWDQTKGGEAARDLAAYGGFDRDEKRSLLAPVALWFHEGGTERLEADAGELRGEVSHQFEEIFGDGAGVARQRAQQFLQVIDERAGLLEEREVGVYAFGHLTFQEYLAARSLADREDYVDYTLRRLHDPWWREVLLLQVGHLSSTRHSARRARQLTSALIRAIRDAGSEFEGVLRRDLLLAGRCLCDVGRLGVNEELRRSIYDELAQAWRGTPYVPLRQEIESLFAAAGEEEAGRFLDTVREGLRAEDRAQSYRSLGAIERLCQANKGLATPQLLEELFALIGTAPGSEDVQLAAASALGAVIEAVAGTTTAPLPTAGNRGPDQEEARSSVDADAAGECTFESIVARLLKMTHQHSRAVQCMAVLALDHLDVPTPSVVERLLELARLQSTPPPTWSALAADKRLRQTAWSALGHLGMHHVKPDPSLASLIRGQLLELLPEAKDDGEGSLGQALGHWVERADATNEEGQAVVRDLLALARQGNATVRANALRALLEIKDSDASAEVVQALGAALEDDEADGTLRFAVARALAYESGNIPAPLSLLLLELTRDEDEDVRWAATHALTHAAASLGVGPVFERLLELIGDEDDAVRGLATRCLGILVRAKHRPDAAGEGTAPLADQLVEHIVRRLRERERAHPWERFDYGAMAGVLGDMGKAAATPEVLNLLFDLMAEGEPEEGPGEGEEDEDEREEYEEVRHTAAWALVQLASADTEAARFVRERRAHLVRFWEERLLSWEGADLPDEEREADGSYELAAFAYHAVEQLALLS